MGISIKLKGPPQPNLFLVEGKDDENFIEAFLKFNKITNVDIFNCKGKSLFDENVQRLPLINTFDAVKKIGIIRDADNDHGGAFQSISDSLKKVGLTPPSDTNSLSNGVPQVGIFILPLNGKDGTLEDLCLESVNQTPAMKCVESFYQCASQLPNPPQNPSKSKAKAYLAVMEESVPHIGTAASKNYWDFSSPVMNDLRSFLRLFA